MYLGDFSEVHPARGDWYGSYMLADPHIARDLRWLGVDVMSTANNHSLDFGERGLVSTPRALSRRRRCAPASHSWTCARRVRCSAGT